MKFLPFILLYLIALNGFSQEKKIQIDGQLVGTNGKPVAYVHVINFRTLEKNASNANGIFSVWVLPGDSLLLSHIAYHRKVVSVHNLLVNPIIQLHLDSVNIDGIDVSPDQMTDYQKAMENINAVQFDFKPKVDDEFTESERMDNLIKTENSVERAAASSVRIATFSPSEQIGKLFKKLKKKDKTQDYKSTRKLKKQESK